MGKSFDWFTTRTYVDNSSNRNLSTSALHNLCKNQHFLFIWQSFWLTVETSIKKTNKLNFSDKLSPYKGKLFQLKDFPRQALYTWGDNCSLWVIFSDKLSPHGEINDIFKWFSVLISCPLEKLEKRLNVLFMVFPYMVRDNNPLFVIFNHHFFLALLQSKWLKTDFFRFFCCGRLAKNL